MTTILNMLFEVTVYSAIIFGAVWLFRLLFKKHVSPAMLYVVWFLLIARLLVPVTVQSEFSFFVIPAAQSDTQLQNEALSPLPESGSTEVTNLSAPQTDSTPPSVQNAPQLQSTAAETSASPKPAQLEITWETALILLWLAGAAAMLAQIAVSSLKLKKRLKSASPIPPEWKQISDGLKAEFGLPCIRAIMITGFPSPALSAGLKPVIILPEELLSHSEETVRFALLHELTHIRRKDHIVCIFLLLLRAVYWFNPVVWLTVKQMRLDMETACDNSLTKPMSGADKKLYAGTILSMYASRQVRFALGMALGQTKKTAERRLRGVFMRYKSSLNAKLTAILLAAALLFTCFTTACQPITERPAVNLHWAPKPPGSYKVSEHWNETVEKDKVKIVIDADVFVPDVKEYPVVKLERASFTQQRVDELVNYFAKGNKLYLPRPMTKADYAQLIEYNRGSDDDSYIKWLEEMQAAAPEDPPPLIYTDTTLKYGKDETGKEITEDGKNFLSVMIGNGDADDASIGISNCTDDSSTSLSYFKYRFNGVTESMYQNNVIGAGLTEAECGYTGAGELFGKVDITEEEAIAQMDKVISELGIKDLMLVNSEEYVYVTKDSPKQGGYMLEYSRQSGGIPLSWLDGFLGNGQEELPPYSPPFMEEVLIAYVTKDGIATLYWYGCAKVVETVSENAELLPFESIRQALKDRIFYKNSFQQEHLPQDFTVTITSAELRMGYIGVKDNAKQALMVPVWFFRADETCTENGKTVLLNKLTFMLNALDGGAIEDPRGL